MQRCIAACVLAAISEAARAIERPGAAGPFVRIEPDRVTADKVRQLIYFPAMEEKIPLLVGLIRGRAGGRPGNGAAGRGAA